ncbi:MAG: GTP 3',8-cyclase MoaA [Nitrospirae bacterium]|nr:GTP 3',8-cyclase MoaA [Nitrospirota bacterium]
MIGPLQDQFDRKIDYMRVSVTDRCNLRCIYCMPSEGVKFIDHHEILRYEEILRIVRVASRFGISKVRITGGEPLMRRDIVRFIASLSEESGIEDISLTTNGVLLKLYAGDLFKAGLHRINVSLDSLDPVKYERITRGNHLSDVWEGIEEAERIGLKPIKINNVPIRGFNDDEILDFAILTIKKPIGVRFIEFMPIGAKEIWEERKYISTEEIKNRIRVLGDLKPVNSDRQAGPAENYRLPKALGVIGFISPLSNHFCSTCNRLRLTSDGKLRPCLFSESEIDLKNPIRNGCDDDEIERLLCLAVQIKPQGHRITERMPCRFQKTMSKIGG